MPGTIISYKSLFFIVSQAMAEAAPSDSHLLVAAIDFGTTFSGYAYSFKNDPLKIHHNATWNAGTENLMSYKTPTCILLNARKEFDSFGFEAENKYVYLAESDKHHGWMLFQRFKMTLHEKVRVKQSRQRKNMNITVKGYL